MSAGKILLAVFGGFVVLAIIVALYVGGMFKRLVTIQQGIPIEAAREIVKFIKDKKLKKVQAAIQADQVRVTSTSKDELQEAMRVLREHDFGVALQFGNYR